MPGAARRRGALVGVAMLRPYHVPVMVMMMMEGSLILRDGNFTFPVAGAETVSSTLAFATFATTCQPLHRPAPATFNLRIWSHLNTRKKIEVGLASCPPATTETGVPLMF